MRPQIRFKEFTDDWEEKKLGEIADIKAGKDLDKSKLINVGYPVYGNALTNKGLMGYYDTYEIKDEAVTVTGRGDIGKAFYRKGKFNTVGRLISIVSKENPYFLAYAINKIKILNETTGVPQLTALQLKKYKVHIPSLPEQEKIGKFFSLLDQRIEKQERKVALLEERKKGWMQKLFNQEIRFKGNYPDWEEKKLGDIAKIKTGNADLQDKDKNGKYPFFVRSAQVERINTYDYDGEAILIPGDGKIGDIYHYINGKFNYHQRVYKISDFNVNVMGKYIYYYMIFYFKKEAMKNSVKATVDSLRLPTIQNFKIQLPSLPEQEKIANFLSAQDELIEKEKEKLNLMKQEKKSFMQRMFV